MGLRRFHGYFGSLFFLLRWLVQFGDFCREAFAVALYSCGMFVVEPEGREEREERVILVGVESFVAGMAEGAPRRRSASRSCLVSLSWGKDAEVLVDLVRDSS